MIDILSFCNSFFHANYIPISYYKQDGELVASMPEQIKSVSSILDQFDLIEELEMVYIAGFAVFFKIDLEEKNGILVIGPFCTSKPSKVEMNDFIASFTTLEKEAFQLELQLHQIPITSINQSLFILDQAYTALKHEQINVFEYFGFIQPSKASIQADLTDQLYTAKEEVRYHNTYYFEKRLGQAVQSGNVQKLHDLLVNQDQEYHAGELSENRLRQLKNIFITATTLTVRYAIEGGLSIEKAYQLSDIYITECEHLSDEASIYGLTYTMYIDFVKRVAESKQDADVSQPVQMALNYIQSHTNLSLTVQEVADHVGFSYSFFSKQFKSETNKTINEAILEAKIEEAKELLAFTNKSISHISHYLAFSSQSYFQNQFKKLLVSLLYAIEKKRC